MNIASYSGRDIQMFLSLLNQLEIDGILDIRFAREMIQRKIDVQAVQIKSKMRQGNKGHHRAKRNPVCPSCGNGQLQQVGNDEGLKIMACRSCRWSALDEVR